MSPEVVSNTQADRAGQLLREDRIGENIEDVKLEQARETVERFRLRFLEPHLLVGDSLQGIVDQFESGVIVTPRLKRYERMVEKLMRQPHMRLSQMQDIGGCRAVLPRRLDGSPGAPGLDALKRIADGVRSRWPLIAEDDYVARPRSTGYRALHLVVREGGVAIEIQLRTFRQDQWAELVESIARNTGFRLADGQGPDDLLALLRVSAEISAINDRGEAAPRSVVSDFERLLPTLGSILRSEPPETG